MKQINEYYENGLKHHNKWLKMQKTMWWKTMENLDLNINTYGDYIETVDFLTEEQKNDSSIFHNHTNVVNSEYSILFNMLGEALIDYCVELDQNLELWDTLYSFGFSISRNVVDGENVYEYSFILNNIDGKMEEDEHRNHLFDECAGFLCDIVDWFVSKHQKNIPNDWNSFTFGLDALLGSCADKRWSCVSDGYMEFGKYTEENKYVTFVECM